MDAQTPRERFREHPESLLLYAVSDDAWLHGRTLAACCADAVRGGATFMQLRAKRATTAELVAAYDAIRAELAAQGLAGKVPFVIDDDVEAALVVGADGVHVGQSDTSCESARSRLGEGVIVGVSAQTVEQALAAQAAGADYLGVGALFKTATKPEAADVMLETLREICAAVDIPVVGIGGLNAATLGALAHTGAYGAAVVSAIFATDDIAAAAADLRSIMERIELSF